jgi:hypothetical protein
MIFGRNAFGFRSSVCSIADCRSCACSTLFLHPAQLHASQYFPLAKHSQYSLRHFEFLQLHRFLCDAESRGVEARAAIERGDADAIASSRARMRDRRFARDAT